MWGKRTGGLKQSTHQTHDVSVDVSVFIFTVSWKVLRLNLSTQWHSRMQYNATLLLYIEQIFVFVLNCYLFTPDRVFIRLIKGSWLLYKQNFIVLIMSSRASSRVRWFKIYTVSGTDSIPTIKWIRSTRSTWWWGWSQSIIWSGWKLEKTLSNHVAAKVSSFM